MDLDQPRPRKAWVAVVLTLLAPGLGHFYTGHPYTALRRYLTVLSLGIGAIALVLLVPLGALSLPLLVVTIFGLYIWTARDAARHARAAPTDYRLRRYNRWYVYAALLVLSGFVRELPITFMEAYRQPSGSMTPALQVGDWFFAKKGPWRPAPELGSVVILESPEANMGLIAKRIVGVPGDTLQMRSGIFTRNGARPDEPFVDPKLAGEAWSDISMSWQKPRLIGVDTGSFAITTHEWGPLVVPSDSFFVMGDNRDASKDSRYFGFVAGDRIRGAPQVVYYSYDPDGDRPLPFLTALRWDRVGRRVQ